MSSILAAAVAEPAPARTGALTLSLPRPGERGQLCDAAGRVLDPRRSAQRPGVYFLILPDRTLKLVKPR